MNDAKIPEGHRLVTCSNCGDQQVVPEDPDENWNCRDCGSKLPRY